MQSTQATQAHRAPRCRHVLSRARCVVYLGPPSFTFNTATPIRLYPPVHPYLCGVVLSTDTCHPSSNGTRAVAPLICKQCLTPRPNTETLSSVHQTRTAQTARWHRDLPHTIPRRDNDSVELQDLSTRADPLGN